MTGEAERGRVSTQQWQLCIRAVHDSVRSLSISVRGANSLLSTPGASQQLLCHVISSCAMSSAHPHHQLARHPPACAAQGSSSGCPTQCKQTGMAAGIHRSAPKGAVRELRARQDQAKVMRLQCLARAEERPALTQVWTCQRMIPWSPCFCCLEAGTPPSLGDTNPQCVLVSFGNLQPQNCSNF